MQNLTPILLPLFGLWTLGILLVLFRRGLGAAYKISALLIYVFYGLWFLEPTLASLSLYLSSLNTVLPELFGLFKNLAGLGLLFLWPLALFAVFQMGGTDRAAGLLRTMVLLTLFFWLFWLLNYFLAPWPEELLRSLLPDQLQMPDIPPPPTEAQ